MPHIFDFKLRSCLLHGLLVNIDFTEFLLSKMKQGLRPAICLTNQADLEALGVGCIIANYSLKHLACGNAKMNRHLDIAR